MLELILVRHGETDSNKKGTYLGWTDVELNEEGVRQACTARDKLKDSKIDAVYASPLKRVRNTAEIINEYHNLEIVYTDALKERNFGVWDDLTHKDILKKHPVEYSEWTKDWINYCVEGGESSAQAYQRITGFTGQLVNENNNCTILIVTHLGCIRKMISYLLGMSIEGSWRFKVDNAAVTKLQINDEKYAYLTLMNG